MSEIWWIYSPVNGVTWAGLRIAHFELTSNSDTELVVISGESDPRRIGMRVWEDVQRNEHWYKVEQITVPSLATVVAAAIKQDFITEETPGTKTYRCRVCNDDRSVRTHNPFAKCNRCGSQMTAIERMERQQ